MKKEFKAGHHMTWNSEAGHAQGTITKKIISTIAFKGCTIHVSKEAPRYLIQGETTDHLDTHKGATLKKPKSKR